MDRDQRAFPMFPLEELDGDFAALRHTSRPLTQTCEFARILVSLCRGST